MVVFVTIIIIIIIKETVLKKWSSQVMYNEARGTIRALHNQTIEDYIDGKRDRGR